MDTVLTVDDMEFCRQFITAALELAGYKALSACDGIDALSMLEKHPVNLVILDAEMPKLDGPGFLQAIRRDARFLHLPVILLTAHSNRELVVQTRMMGAQDFLAKSNLDANELLARVKRHLALANYTPPGSAPAPVPAPAPPSVTAPVPAPATPPAPKQAAA